MINFNLVAISYQLPDLEGKPNLTTLDIQIQNLRDKTMASVKEAAIRMREEAVDVRATMPDIEDWLERLQQITEEVWHCLVWHKSYTIVLEFVSRRECCISKSQIYIIKSPMSIQMFVSIHNTASEQYAWCYHMDAERRETCGLRPNPSQSGSLLHPQRAGCRQVLRQDAKHLYAGNFEIES